MARDRKRAKQRQRRRAQPPRPASPDGGARDDGVDDALAADEVVADESLEPDAVAGAPVDDEVVEDEIVHDDREDDPVAAPDPLAHASGDADIARLAEASIPEPGQDDAPLSEDEYPQPDETEGADVFGRTPAERAAPARPGAELPREGNRFVNFLRACVAELRRVQWPDRRHVGQATGVVLGFVVIAGGYLGLLDAVFSRLIKVIL